MKLTTQCLLLVFAVSACSAGSVTVNIYNSGTDTGTGVTFGGFNSSFQTTDLLSCCRIPACGWGDYGWFPRGCGTPFASDVTGSLYVPATGPYTFSLTSDDGSYLFIDGVLVINNGGSHGPTSPVAASPTLTAGWHTFEVQANEVNGGQSGWSLTVPPGVTYQQTAPVSPIPLPPSVILVAVGLAGAGLYQARRRVVRRPGA
jgi:hypothetical protein